SLYDHLQSGVTPEDSHVYVMYHGTSKQAAVEIQRNGFTPSRVGMLGAGVYLSRDIRKVIRYPLGSSDSNRMVLKVKVNVGRVKVINKQGHDNQYNWHTHGFDTAWVPPGVGMVPSNQEEDCVYDPKRIKVMALLDVTNEHPEDHKEYVMFHGTTKEATELIKKNGFTPSREELGPGVYVSRDIGKAIKYPLGVSNNKRRVLKVKVDVGKVKIIDQQNHPMQETWHTEHGYDTAWVPPGVSMVLSNQQGNCVYDPKRIKVITANILLVLPVMNN
uniref:PARP catalytic domain-containing protein n=1 Tax=Oncorhynchus kisutch TaxID=8019 RepID=A0A8C7IDL0_ONCKI